MFDIARCPCTTDGDVIQLPYWWHSAYLGLVGITLFMWIVYGAGRFCRMGIFGPKSGIKIWSRFLGLAETQDSFARKVEERLQQRRLERLRRAIEASFCIAVPVLAVTGFISTDPLLTVKYVSFEALLFMWGCLFFLLFPQCLTIRRANFAVGAIWVLVGVHPVLSMNAVVFAINQAACFLGQMLMAQLIADVKPILLAQLPVVVVQTYYITKYEGLHENNTRAYYNILAVGVCFTFVTAFATERTMREQARQEVLKGLASTGEATAKSLLSVMSDAVLKLGPDLMLLEPSPHLDALLLRTHSTKCWSFPSCIKESDVERFQAFIGKNIESGRAGSLHASLVDSTGTKVQVQLFHAPMVEIDGTVSNMVGILEENCSDGFQVQRVTRLPSDLETAPRHEAPTPAEEDAGSVTSQRSGRSGASSSGVDLEVLENIVGSCAGGSENLGDVTVDLALSLHLQVLCESDECRALFAFGTSGPAGFLGRFTDPSALQNVKGWLDSLFSAGRYGGGRGTFQKLGSVKMFNPLSTTTQMVEIEGRYLRTEETESKGGHGPEALLERVIRFRLVKPSLRAQLQPQGRRRRQRAWHVGANDLQSRLSI